MVPASAEWAGASGSAQALASRIFGVRVEPVEFSTRRMAVSRKLGMCVGLVGLFAMIGCGGPKGLPSVKGTVLYKGQPVQGATVSFVSDDGRMSVGTTDDKGQFSLSTGTQPGAPPGRYRVGVVKRSAVPGASGVEGADPTEMMKKMMVGKGKMPEAKHELPEKYAEPMKSPLTYEVSSDSSKNNFTIELSD